MKQFKNFGVVLVSFFNFYGYHTMRTSFVFKAIAFVITCFSVLARSQTYTPVPYNFSDRVGSITKSGFYTPLDFVSMASNGYGHWGVTADGKWFLMSNELPWGEDHEREPKGPVQAGEFIGNFYWKGGFKVATNLQGSVRFVAPSSGHQSFHIFGFDDEHLRTLPDTPDIRY